MKKGVYYDKVFSTLAGWYSIRILLILVSLEVWMTIQVYYVQSFTHAPIDKDLYLNVPAGFQV